jgi:hypothetical protein
VWSGDARAAIANGARKWDYRVNTYLGCGLAYQFDFDSCNGIVRCRLEGGITDGEMKEVYREAGAYANFTKARAGILDFSGATSFDVSRQTILELAHSEPAIQDAAVVRVVIAASPVVFGLARMFEMEGERTRPNFHVVRTEQEAWAILRVWKPQFEPVKKDPS